MSDNIYLTAPLAFQCCSNPWVAPLHGGKKTTNHITQCLMKKGVKGTKGIKRTNRMHQTGFQLCDGGGSCVLTLPRGSLLEVYSSLSIRWCPRVWFHHVLSNISRKTLVPGVRQCDSHSNFGVLGFGVGSNFLTTWFCEKSLKPRS